MSDNHSTDTGQISVAELLARNGQKVSTRSGGRRRRGASGGISVAELTGEIPITRSAGDKPATEPKPKDEPAPAPEPSAEATAVVPAVAVKSEPAVKTDAVAKTDTAGKPEPVATKTEPSPPTRVAPKIESPTEIIRPDALPRRAREHLDSVVTVTARTGAAEETAAPESTTGPSLRKAGVAEPRLLSGPASDLQASGADEEDTETPGPDGTSPATGTGTTADARNDTARDETAEAKGSGLKQWALLVGESIAAIVAGGLLFKGFERLWDLMPWVAFALALVVIVGLVALVRVLRRTDDITSQLIALAVGAFVSFGPLLFLLPGE